MTINGRVSLNLFYIQRLRKFKLCLTVIQIWLVNSKDHSSSRHYTFFWMVLVETGCWKGKLFYEESIILSFLQKSQLEKLWIIIWKYLEHLVVVNSLFVIIIILLQTDYYYFTDLWKGLTLLAKLTLYSCTYSSQYAFYPLLVTFGICVVIYPLEYLLGSARAADVCLCLEFIFAHLVPYFHFSYCRGKEKKNFSDYITLHP